MRRGAQHSGLMPKSQSRRFHRNESGSGSMPRHVPLNPSRMPVMRGTSLPLPRNTKRQRLLKAIANDNGGRWFLVSSRLSIAELDRRFRWGLVGRVLYDRIGGILKGPKEYLYMQIALVTDVADQHEITKEIVWTQVPTQADTPEWAVTVALRDLGVTVIEPCHVEDVLAARRY
jgi:hypothetical protein